MSYENAGTSSFNMAMKEPPRQQLIREDVKQDTPPAFIVLRGELSLIADRQSELIQEIINRISLIHPFNQDSVGESQPQRAYEAGIIGELGAIGILLEQNTTYLRHIAKHLKTIIG